MMENIPGNRANHQPNRPHPSPRRRGIDGQSAHGAVTPPINAAAAARRAASAPGAEQIRLRQAAAGVSAERARALGRDKQSAGRAVRIAAVAVGGTLALLLAIIIFRGLMGVALFDDLAAKNSAPAGASSSDEAAVRPPEDPEDDVAAADGTLSWNDLSYTLAQDSDGTWWLCYQYRDSDAAPLPACALTSEAVGFARRANVIYLVSTNSSRTFVQAYVYADGSLPADLADFDGKATSIDIEGDELRLFDQAGHSVGSVPLQTNAS